MKITERHLKDRVIQINRDLKVMGHPFGLRVDRNPVKGYMVERVFRSNGHTETGLQEATAGEASAYIDGFFDACLMLQKEDGEG